MASRAEPSVRPRSARLRHSLVAALPRLNLVVVIAIVTLDLMTPAGVVVGILLSIPIILTSMHDDPKQIWITSTVALAGFLLAAGFGRGPYLLPDTVWIPNRLFAFLTIPASAYLALLLQRRRKESEFARDAALSARDLNRLLMSLLAHDLRTPLTLATQGLDYVAGATEVGEPVDVELISDLRARLQRSLRAVEVVLTVARENLQGAGSVAHPAVPLARVGPEIAAEIDSFASEARHHGKTLVASLAGLEGERAPLQVDGLVLRQSMAVLLDNAIRHAHPGQVRVDARRDGDTLVLRIGDQGPGLSAARAGGASPAGSGLGLELARTLVTRIGGRLDVESDSPTGTEFVLRLPLQAPLEARVRNAEHLSKV